MAFHRARARLRWTHSCLPPRTCGGRPLLLMSQSSMYIVDSLSVGTGAVAGHPADSSRQEEAPPTPHTYLHRGRNHPHMKKKRHPPPHVLGGKQECVHLNQALARWQAKMRPTAKVASLLRQAKMRSKEAVTTTSLRRQAKMRPKEAVTTSGLHHLWRNLGSNRSRSLSTKNLCIQKNVAFASGRS